jgi:hypothetical protein
MHCDVCANAYRVLGSDGRPRTNFAWSDPTEKRTVRLVLHDEGVRFSDNGTAEATQRVSAEELRARVATVPADQSDADLAGTSQLD